MAESLGNNDCRDSVIHECGTKSALPFEHAGQSGSKLYGPRSGNQAWGRRAEKSKEAMPLEAFLEKFKHSA